MKALTPKRGDAAKIVVSVHGHRAAAPAAALAPTEFKIGKILVPIDFSEHSQKALQYALAFASQFSAEVVLVHIIEQVVYPGDWMYPPLATSDFAHEKRENLVEKLKAMSAETPIKAEHVVRFGRAWQEIIEIAKEQKSDLIVVGTHGYTGLRHVLLGSVAEKVVRHAPCPVLTVRPDERDFL